jgi:hypothetical protein
MSPTERGQSIRVLMVRASCRGRAATELWMIGHRFHESPLISHPSDCVRGTGSTRCRSVALGADQALGLPSPVEHRRLTPLGGVGQTTKPSRCALTFDRSMGRHRARPSIGAEVAANPGRVGAQRVIDNSQGRRRTEASAGRQIICIEALAVSPCHPRYRACSLACSQASALAPSGAINASYSLSMSSSDMAMISAAKS